MANDDAGRLIADALGALLRRGARAHLWQSLTEGLGEGIDELTYPVLGGLARVRACSAAELAARIGLDRSTVTRRADRLERAGLLRREPDPADRRATLLRLTGPGRESAAVVRERLAERIRASLAGWSPAEVDAFARSLRRFTDEGPFASPGE